MRAVKVLGTIVFGAIIIIAIGGYFFVRNFDLNKYKPYISEMVKNQINRELVMRGDASIGISLIPTVVVNDVELSNPEWAANPAMVKVQQVEVKFAVLPLLKKQIVIDKVSLINPEINLEKAKNGENNWTFGSVAAAPKVSPAVVASLPSGAQAAVQSSAATAMAGFAAKNVLIENGLVTYLDGASGKTTTLAIRKVKMEAPSVTDEMTVAFDLVLDNQKVNGEMTLGALQTLLDGKNPYPFSLEANALGIDINLEGSVADIMISPRYAVQANVYNPAGNMNAPETTLKALIDGDMNSADIKIQTLNLVNNLVTGTAVVDWSAKVPQVKLNLQSDKINLMTLTPNSTFAFKLPSLISEAQATTLVPDTAIPYAVLKQVNASVKAKIGQLIVAQGMQADNVDLTASLQNGVLNVKPLTFDFGGGNLTVTAQLNANTQGMTLTAVSKNMTLQDLHREFKVSGQGDFGVLSGGDVDLDINLSGSGATYRQLVQSLAGKMIAIVDKSVIQTGNLQFMTGNFVSQLLSTIGIDSKKAGQLNLSCAVVRADFGSGKANFPKGIAVNSEQLILVGDGHVNLMNDKIDFAVKPFSGKVIDTNIAQALTSFLKVQGTLQNPKIVLDDKEALKTIVGVATTGGAAYIGSKLALDVDSSPCYTALEGTAFSKRFPKPTGAKAAAQDVYQGVSNGINDSLQAVGDTAKGFFKAIKKGIKDAK